MLSVYEYFLIDKLNWYMAFLQNIVPSLLNWTVFILKLSILIFVSLRPKMWWLHLPSASSLDLTCLLSQSSLSFPVLCLHNTRVQAKQKSLKNNNSSILLIEIVLELYQIHIIISDSDFSSILPKLHLGSNLFKLYKQKDMKEACFCLDIS